MACSSWESRSQPSAASISVLQLAHLFHQGVEVGVRIGHLLTDLVEAGDLRRHIGPNAILMFSPTVLVVVQRRLLLQDAHREARGQAGLAVADGPPGRP